MKIKNISNLEIKAHKHLSLSDSYCCEILNQIFKFYKKTREDFTENNFLSSLGCFIQAGDGIVFTDEQGSNVDHRYLYNKILKDGFFDYNDFINARI